MSNHFSTKLPNWVKEIYTKFHWQQNILCLINLPFGIIKPLWCTKWQRIPSVHCRVLSAQRVPTKYILSIHIYTQCSYKVNFECKSSHIYINNMHIHINMLWMSRRVSEKGQNVGFQMTAWPAGLFIENVLCWITLMWKYDGLSIMKYINIKYMQLHEIYIYIWLYIFTSLSTRISYFDSYFKLKNIFKCSHKYFSCHWKTIILRKEIMENYKHFGHR